MKTTRFKTVVERAGRPSVHLSWLPLNRNSVLHAAISAQRVRTIHQVMRGGRKDFGTVGFEKVAQSQFLIFPKSPRKFSDRHVVAIDYSLLAEQPKTDTPAPEIASRQNLVGRKKTPSPATVPVRPRPRARPAQLVPFEPPPPLPLLIWTEAAQELAQIKRAIKTKPLLVSGRIESLLDRIKARQQPPLTIVASVRAALYRAAKRRFSATWRELEDSSSRIESMSMT